MSRANKYSIVTSYVNPPIPYRANDWAAFFDGQEETGQCGYGETEEQAILDLIQNYELPA
jgi:hypothetical protein